MSESLINADGEPYAGYILSFIILILAAIAIVVSRLFAKWRFARNVKSEDWFSVVALVGICLLSLPKFPSDEMK